MTIKRLFIYTAQCRECQWIGTALSEAARDAAADEHTRYVIWKRGQLFCALRRLVDNNSMA